MNDARTAGFGDFDDPDWQSPKTNLDDEDYSRIFDAVRRALRQAGLVVGRMRRVAFDWKQIPEEHLEDSAAKDQWYASLENGHGLHVYGHGDQPWGSDGGDTGYIAALDNLPYDPDFPEDADGDNNWTYHIRENESSGRLKRFPTKEHAMRAAEEAYKKHFPLGTNTGGHDSGFDYDTFFNSPDPFDPRIIGAGLHARLASQALPTPLSAVRNSTGGTMSDEHRVAASTIGDDFNEWYEGPQQGDEHISPKDNRRYYRNEFLHQYDGPWEEEDEDALERALDFHFDKPHPMHQQLTEQFGLTPPPQSETGAALEQVKNWQPDDDPFDPRLGGIHRRLAAKADPTSASVRQRIAAELFPPCPDCGQVAGFQQHPISPSLVTCRNCDYPMFDENMNRLIGEILGDHDRAVRALPETDHPTLGKHGQLSCEDTMKLIDDCDDN